MDDEYIGKSLDVLHSALTPQGLDDAKKHFEGLENMLEGTDNYSIIKTAKPIFDELYSYKNNDTFGDEYISKLRELRNALLGE